MVRLILFLQPRGCKGKGRDRGYKVTNMAPHAASLVYTLATQCALLLQFHSKPIDQKPSKVEETEQTAKAPGPCVNTSSYSEL